MASSTPVGSIFGSRTQIPRGQHFAALARVRLAAMGSPRGTMKLELPTIGNRFADDRRQPLSPLATPLTGGASPVDLLTKRKKWLVEPPRLRGDDKDPGVVGHEVFFNSAFGFSFGILKVSQFIIDDRYPALALGQN